jgi:hypothetical protein
MSMRTAASSPRGRQNIVTSFTLGKHREERGDVFLTREIFTPVRNPQALLEDPDR